MRVLFLSRIRGKITQYITISPQAWCLSTIRSGMVLLFHSKHWFLSNIKLTSVFMSRARINCGSNGSFSGCRSVCFILGMEHNDPSFVWPWVHLRAYDERPRYLKMYNPEQRNFRGRTVVFIVLFVWKLSNYFIF